MSLQATGDYVAASSQDGTWALLDIQSYATLAVVAGNDDQQPLTSAGFHPDGIVLCTTNQNGSLRMWDIRAMDVVAEHSGHDAPICAMAFSERGYYLTMVSRDGALKLWDLRSMSPVKELTLPSSEAYSVCFNSTGHYVAAGSTDLRYVRIPLSPCD